MKNRLYYISLCVMVLFNACKKDSSDTQNGSVAKPIALQNQLTCKIGNISFNTNNFTIQPLINTYLSCNYYRATNHPVSDTIAVGFTLKATSAGTYILDSNSIGLNHRIVIALNLDGSPSQNTYFSKSGVVTITTFDSHNWIYAGTFSGVLESENNPNDTLLLTNGIFYYKHF